MIAIKNNTVLTAHTTGVKTNNISKYNRVFAISNTVKNDIEKRSSVKPIVIYNGIKIEQVKQKVDYNFSIFKIVQVGRLDHEIKGQHILLKALKIIVYEKGVKNISVDFIGEGKSLDYLNGLVKEYHLEDYISFLGMRDRKFIYEHLKDYNLLVQPSLYEGFGLTIVEAMAAKVPVLVSDIDGPLEVIGFGKYGWIFRSNDANDSSTKILEIINFYRNQTFKKLNDSYDYAYNTFNINNTSNNYLVNY
jgi:glycosyltransferase involved in cell wall biosynthesis